MGGTSRFTCSSPPATSPRARAFAVGGNVPPRAPPRALLPPCAPPRALLTPRSSPPLSPPRFRPPIYSHRYEILKQFSKKRVTLLRTSAIASMGQLFIRAPHLLQSDRLSVDQRFRFCLQDKQHAVRQQTLRSFTEMLTSTAGEFIVFNRYISCESCAQFDSLPRTFFLIASTAGEETSRGEGASGAAGAASTGSKVAHAVLIMADDSPESQVRTRRVCLLFLRSPSLHPPSLLLTHAHTTNEPHHSFIH